ncbi:MAG: cell division protein FtsA [Treponema sp.]|nr:cell division protein FtsA [Treponema sp.]
MSNVVVGLDVGTSFVRVVIAEVKDDGNMEIIGVSKVPSQGLRNGVIVNIDAVVASIKEAVESAEQSAGQEVVSVYTAIGGSQVESQNSKGQIGVDQSGRNRPLEISRGAKDRAIDAAKAVSITLDKKLLHVIPQEYIIDGSPGYKSPLGMMGVRLEVAVHLVTASITALSNINQCVTRAGYGLNGTMLKTLAAAYACVLEDEMELGSILIDLGGGTTDVMVLNKGAPVYTVSIPVGGNHVTNDIATVKGIPTAVAEKIKVEKGCCWILGNERAEEVIIPGVGGRAPEQTNRYELCEIINPRMEEIFTMAKQKVVRYAKLSNLSGSIILTGGGALMSGVVELAQYVWHTSSVRIGGSPDMGKGVDPCYRAADFATVTGLVIANRDVEHADKGFLKGKKAENTSGGEKNSGIKGFLRKFF